MNQKQFFTGENRDHTFILFSKRFPFDWADFPQAFFPIVGLFARDSNFNIRDCSSTGTSNLSIKTYYRGRAGTLYLRYNYALEHRLVVATVEFIHRRQGNMTELFSILKQIRRAYSTGPIVIESVVSDEMEAWCKKNGFVLEPGTKNNYIWPPTAITVAREP